MKKRTFIMLMCAVLVLTSAAFGTIAYLTDRESIKNTFTVGNVQITLDETKVNEYGQPKKGDNVLESGSSETPDRVSDDQTFKLVPGQTYVKDPTMTVLKGSEESYVSMVVEITKADELIALYDALNQMDSETYPKGTDLAKKENLFMVKQFVTSGSVDENGYFWKNASKTYDGTANTFTLVYYLKQKKDNTDVDVIVSAPNADVKLPALFEKVNVPKELTSEWLATIKDMDVTVYGRAIQAAGFTGAEDAWTAFDQQQSVALPPPTTTGTEEAPEQPVAS